MRYFEKQALTLGNLKMLRQEMSNNGINLIRSPKGIFANYAPKERYIDIPKDTKTPVFDFLHEFGHFTQGHESVKNSFDMMKKEREANGAAVNLLKSFGSDKVDDFKQSRYLPYQTYKRHASASLASGYDKPLPETTLNTFTNNSKRVNEMSTDSVGSVLDIKRTELKIFDKTDKGVKEYRRSMSNKFKDEFKKSPFDPSTTIQGLQ